MEQETVEKHREVFQFPDKNKVLAKHPFPWPNITFVNGNSPERVNYVALRVELRGMAKKMPFSRLQAEESFNL
jgi:hypothetical protein